jgi:hypothetical protein
MARQLQATQPQQKAPAFEIDLTDMLALSKRYAQQRGLPCEITAWTREDIAIFLSWWAQQHPRPV